MNALKIWGEKWGFFGRGVLKTPREVTLVSAERTVRFFCVLASQRRFCTINFAFFLGDLSERLRYI